MKRSNVTMFAAALACALGVSLAIPPAATASTPRDRAFVDCTRGSMLQVDLEREGRQFEVDVEIYAAPRERWTITIGTPGRTAHTLRRTTNREGELNAWRYMSLRNKSIEVKARSAAGETCRAIVRG